jgi:tetratricopeptide (TPR) repeat protein
VPTLERGQTYLVEAVVRTLGLGHPFSQGTADSNEIWVELVAREGEHVLGRSGGIGADGTVDPFAHFINIYMLDRNGNRIDRRNPQDIFVPLYNKQVPPGAGQVVHFALDVPAGLFGPIVLEARVNYRKFDRRYMDYVFGKGQGPVLPVVVMAQDRVVLPVAGGGAARNDPSPIKEVWQRWNDYGIGLLLEGSDKGAQKGELRQAESVFRKVADLGVADGWINLARVYTREGRIPEAREALEKATAHSQLAAPWVINWLTGQINDRNGLLDEAIASYEAVLGTRIPARGFDFSGDYEVLNALGASLYARARLEPAGGTARDEDLRRAIAAYRRTLAIDSENVAAHFGLSLAYADLTRSVNLSDMPSTRYDRRPGGSLDEEFLAQAAAATEPSINPKLRAAGALAVAATIPKFSAMPPIPFGSRLEPLHAVVERLGPAFDIENDPAARAALAKALEAAHRSLHAMFKPDESAEGRAVAVARRASPAADQNAQSIVIHALTLPRDDEP